MQNPFENFKKHDWVIWILSVIIVATSNILTGEIQIFTLCATVIGVTALIFVAKGNVWGQILTVIFSILYAIASLQFQYYGEMITYLGMTMPIAALSIVSWIRHPYEKGGSEVEIHKLTKLQTGVMWLLTAVVTTVFFFILQALHTPNLAVSTISIATSFLASYLMLFRNSYYALAYAANDIVLIVLWILASLTQISYVPMVICFSIFLLNDIYGFFSWKLREKRQNRTVFFMQVKKNGLSCCGNPFAQLRPRAQSRRIHSMSCRLRTVDKTLFSPEGGEKIPPIPGKAMPILNESDAYANKPQPASCRFVFYIKSVCLFWI